VFNISSLASGVYMVELTDGKQRHVKKVLIR